MITRLEQIKPAVPAKLAVAWAQDENTITAIAKAVNNNICQALMVGDPDAIKATAQQKGVSPDIFEIIPASSDYEAAVKAVELVKTGAADVLMKGLVGTDKYLKAVLDKQKGLLPPKTVMSHVCAVELPAYHKLLFITDVAVIPFPDLQQKAAMINYAVNIAHHMGVQTPKVALLAAVEKINPKMPNTVDAAILSKMAQRGQIKNCVIDGPLDIFLACDPPSVEIKGVPTPIVGDADVLVFPNIEAANIFYKGLMKFAGGEIAALIGGTEKPVIVTSRAESENSKYYSIALGCLMAQGDK